MLKITFKAKVWAEVGLAPFFDFLGKYLQVSLPIPIQNPIQYSISTSMLILVH